jgi:hypothetical protein
MIQRRTVSLRKLVSVLAVAVALSGCGNDGKSTADAPKAPAVAGQPSPKYGLPLPTGAVAEAAGATGEGEAYRAGSKDSLADINAFYERETDGKPLQGFTWCGGARYSLDKIVRIWKKSETDQLRLELTNDANAVLITLAEDKAAKPTACPPGAPGDQPFEAP